MAHEIMDTDRMMYVGEVPWHGIGKKIEGRPTSEEAIKASGLDWEVGLKPLFAADDVTDNGLYGPSPFGKLQLVSHRATFRKTDGRILGVVGPSWTPLQNREAFSFFDPFIASGQAMYETAGSLRNGQRVWVLAELSGDPIVIVPSANDVVKQYLLLSNSHDGSLAIRVGYTPVRVVCANTLAMAHGSDASKLIKIRHHGSVPEALKKVQEVMNVVQKTFEATADQYRALAAHGCDEATLKKYVNLVFAPRRVKEASKVRLAASIAGDGTLTIGEAESLSAEELRSNVYPKIADLFETGRGNALPGVRGTLWGAYNAINEYIVHERGDDAAMRLDSAWFGQGAVQNSRALKVGVELAEAA